MDEIKCGECRFHMHDQDNDEWVCNNPDSECYGCETYYSDTCDDAEERGML